MPDVRCDPQYDVAEGYRLALEKAVKPSTGHSASMRQQITNYVLQPGRAGLL